MLIKNKVLTTEDLNGQDFNQTVFENCRLTGNIKFCNYSQCKFVACDLSSAVLELCSFTNCSFPDSKLSGINFENISVLGCDFTDTVMENCIFHHKKRFNLKDFTFKKTNLAKSAFVFCDLEKVAFTDCDLSGTVFERCNLKDSDLSSAIIFGTTFVDCIIDKTQLSLDGFVSYGTSKGFVLKSI